MILKNAFLEKHLAHSAILDHARIATVVGGIF